MAFTRGSLLAGFISCPLCAAAARAEDAQWDYEEVHSWGVHDSTH
jgi:carbonic anhydrase